MKGVHTVSVRNNREWCYHVAASPHGVPLHMRSQVSPAQGKDETCYFSFPSSKLAPFDATNQEKYSKQASHVILGKMYRMETVTHGNGNLVICIRDSCVRSEWALVFANTSQFSVQCNLKMRDLCTKELFFGLGCSVTICRLRLRHGDGVLVRRVMFYYRNCSRCQPLL